LKKSPNNVIQAFEKEFNLSLLQTKNMENNLLTAIIFCSEKQVNGNQFLKYHISAKEEKKFLAFAIKFPGAWYVNFYWKHNKQFYKREYLREKR